MHWYKDQSLTKCSLFDAIILVLIRIIYQNLNGHHRVSYISTLDSLI